VSTNAPSYGTPNWELITRWLELPADEDGPFWALNLMKYRAVAAYGEGGPARSGREADDQYAPLGPLAAVGATVAFHADVVEQPLGTPHWDRVGIVRYPTRHSFFDMQQRDDFQEKHVHKEAGMEFSIVMACHPETYTYANDADAAGRLVLTVTRGGPDTKADVANLSVEGLILGDDRTFDTVHFDRAVDDDAVAAIVDRAHRAEEAHVVVLDPAIDRLLATF
jgi:hypothetical protein